jgi:molecular chaperone DnaJ
MSGKRDLYDLLGVRRDADERELKRAYRKLAMQYHPDRNPSPDAANMFREAAEAYEVLTDPAKRALYDQLGHEGLSRNGYGFGAGFSSVEDIFAQFGDLFGDIFNFDQERRTTGGQDMRVEVELTFEESIHGVQRTLSIQRHTTCKTCDGTGAAPGTQPQTCPLCRGKGQIQHMQGIFAMSVPCHGCAGRGVRIEHPCPHCEGRGVIAERRDIQLRIPAGVEDGTRLRVKGEGELGGKGQRGDLFVFVHVQPSERFERDGVHIHCREPISFVQAALGCLLTIQTLHGEEVIEIPPGAQHGDIITLRGQGAPHVHGHARGDLLVHLEIQIPRKLDPAQRALLEQYAALSEISVRAANGHTAPPHTRAMTNQAVRADSPP